MDQGYYGGVNYTPPKTSFWKSRIGILVISFSGLIILAVILALVTTKPGPLGIRFMDLVFIKHDSVNSHILLDEQQQLIHPADSWSGAVNSYADIYHGYVLESTSFSEASNGDKVTSYTFNLVPSDPNTNVIAWVNLDVTKPKKGAEHVTGFNLGTYTK